MKRVRILLSCAKQIKLVTIFSASSARPSGRRVTFGSCNDYHIRGNFDIDLMHIIIYMHLNNTFKHGFFFWLLFNLFFIRSVLTLISIFVSASVGKTFFRYCVSSSYPKTESPPYFLFITCITVISKSFWLYQNATNLDDIPEHRVSRFAHIFHSHCFPQRLWVVFWRVYHYKNQIEFHEYAEEGTIIGCSPLNPNNIHQFFA